MHADGGTLIIRTDASTEIGTGHVMRCIAVAEAWRARGGTPRFLSIGMPDAIRCRVEEAGFEIDEPHARRGSPRDADTTIQHARHRAATWVVADGYAFDTAWQRRVRDAGMRLLVIDDYAHLSAYDADILMNQNVGTARSMYADLSPACECLLGSRYALLRQEFLAMAPSDDRIAQCASRLLVSLGGGDPDDVTTKVLDGLATLDRAPLEVVALVGGANPRAAAIKALETEMPYKLQVEVNSRAPGPHMQWADLAVSAGGSTTWELAYLGVPTCHIVIADNQLGIAEHTERKGFTVNLGWFSRLQPADVAVAVDKLLADRDKRQTMAQAGQTMIDGKGADRVVRAMFEYSESLECVSRAS